MKTTLAILVVLIAAVGAGLGFYWPFGNGKVLTLSGIVEIQEVRLGSKVGGRIARVEVVEGQNVQPKDLLVAIEVPELENQREQLQARVDQAQAEHEKMVNGPRVEEKKAAQAAAGAAKARFDRMVEGWREEEKRWAASELESADAEMKQGNEDFDRVAQLYRNRSVARAEYDAALGQRDRAKGHFNAAKAKNDMYKLGNRKEDVAEAKAEWLKASARADELENGSRGEDKAIAKARLAEARAKLREVEINLKEALVIVPDAKQFRKAVIEVIAVRPGDIVGPGQPVARLLCVDDLWVKVFVPETKLGLVTLHQKVDVTIDSHPGKIFKGEVMQRASISEFTPRNVQSQDERRHQVFGVKVRIEDPQGIFNSGMAAEVMIPLQ